MCGCSRLCVSRVPGMAVNAPLLLCFGQGGPPLYRNMFHCMLTVGREEGLGGLFKVRDGACLVVVVAAACLYVECARCGVAAT